MKKRVLSILTTLALMVGLCTPLGGLAVEAKAAEIVDSGQCGDTLTWQFDSDGTMTISGTGAMEDFPPAAVKPWSRYNLRIETIVIQPGVTSIGDSAFYFASSSNVKSVSIPSTITRIGDLAFAHCEKLEQVTISDNVTEVGERAFEGTGLRSVTVGSGITELPDSIFAGCSSLTNVTLSEGLEVISRSAFWGCTSLKGIKLPDSVTKVSGGAFENCSALEYVILGSGITEFGGQHQGDYSQSSVFYQCTSLKDIYYPGGQEAFSNIKNSSYVAGMAGIEVHYNSDGPGDIASEPEPPTSFIPTPILDDPTGTEEGVSLSWTLPLEIPGETQTVDGFYILRKTAGGSYQRIGQVGEYTHLYVDTSVQEGQTYTYTVQAYYQDQTGDCDQAGKSITWTAYQGVNGTDQTMQVIVKPTAGDWHNQLPLYKEGQNGRFDISLSKKWVDLYPELFQEETGLFDGSLKLLDSDGTVIYTQEAPLNYQGLEDSTANIYIPIYFDKFTKLPLEINSTLTCGLYDREGRLIDSAEIRTSSFQRWGFKNYSTNIPDQLVIELFGKSKGKQLLQQAKNSHFTMGDEGLCFGMAELASLVNAGYIPASSFDGCQVLDQVQKDTKLSNISNVEDTDELIQMAHLLQYKPSVQAQLEKNKGNFDGLKTQVMGFERGMNPMPLIYITDKYIHTLCVYHYSEDLYFYHFYVYDASLMDSLGTIRVEKSSGNWSYVGKEYEGSIDTITYCTVADNTLWTGLGEDHALMSAETYDGSSSNVVPISWISNAAQSAARSGDGSKLYWVSGSQPVELSGPGSIADDHAIYDISAADSCAFAMRNGQVSQVSAVGKGLELQCEYPGKDGMNVTVTYAGESHGEEPVVLTYDADQDTVRFSGGESGTVTVTYENGKTWTEQVEPGKDLTVTADGENTPSTTGGASAAGGGNNPSNLGGSSSGAAVSSFRDVSPSAYYADAVQWAVEQGITAGTSETTFSPDAPCTRAQVVTFLWRTDFPTKTITGPVGFRDVHVGDYFWFPVKWALEMDITAGTSADTFSPDATCTRAQVVTFLYRYLGEATQA